MRQRIATAAAGAALVATACAGCFSKDDNATQKTAHITVDNVSRTSHAITCSQVSWMLTADISAAPAAVRVILRLDPAKPSVESVHFDNFDGFSGVSNAGAGEAKIRVANGTYTITGTATGSRVGDPKVTVTEPFSVDVGC